ncbi:MAG: hypothetical protein HY039_13585 [Nitrospirae bacterium]|nr:hypothetical protein [Nitrospirota bacterium]
MKKAAFLILTIVLLAPGLVQAQQKSATGSASISEYVKTTSADGSTVTYSNLGIGGAERIALKGADIAKCFDAKFDDCRLNPKAVAQAFPDPKSREGKSADRLCGESSCKACKGVFSDEQFMPWHYTCQPGASNEKPSPKKK